jgi:large subunit ribosomal protein L32
MAVPKKKTSKSRRNTRRAHDALSKINVSFDKSTGEAKLSHHMSLKDKMYKGRKILLKAEKSAKDNDTDVAGAQTV